jgi:hypothetical protein
VGAGARARGIVDQAVIKIRLSYPRYGTCHLARFDPYPLLDEDFKRIAAERKKYKSTPIPKINIEPFLKTPKDPDEPTN